MKLRFTVLAASILLFAGIAPAQTAAELLQKGVYTQQTAGKVDDSIDIYRQAITAAGTDRAVAARAQMMIVSAMIQKGDFSGAAREFSAFTANYSDQKDLMSSTSSLMRAIATLRTASAQAPLTPPAPTLGTIQDGVYRHTATGIEIHIPKGWVFQGDGPSSGGGDAAMFNSASRSYFVWMRKNADPISDISQALDQDIEYKIHQRQVDGVQNFRIRQGTTPLKWAAASGSGQRIAAAFEYGADYSDIEYAIYLRSNTNMVYFRALGKASELSGMQNDLAILSEVTTVP